MLKEVITSTSVGDYEYEVKAWAKDEVGNLQSVPSAGYIIYFDTTPPVSVINYPSTNSNLKALAQITGTAQGYIAGLERVEVKISSKDIDTEIKSIEDSLKSQKQTLDEILKAQGMTKKDLRKNIEIQKMIEKLLADKYTVTDEEVQKYIDDNKSTFPEGTNLEEVKTIVKQQLIQQKVSTEFQTWISALKKASKINILVKY